VTADVRDGALDFAVERSTDGAAATDAAVVDEPAAGVTT
jgi:hypothetical protein